MSYSLVSRVLFLSYFFLSPHLFFCFSFFFSSSQTHFIVSTGFYPLFNSSPFIHPFISDSLFHFLFVVFGTYSASFSVSLLFHLFFFPCLSHSLFTSRFPSFCVSFFSCFPSFSLFSPLVFLLCLSLFLSLVFLLSLSLFSSLIFLPPISLSLHLSSSSFLFYCFCPSFSPLFLSHSLSLFLILLSIHFFFLTHVVCLFVPLSDTEATRYRSSSFFVSVLIYFSVPVCLSVSIFVLLFFISLSFSLSLSF